MCTEKKPRERTAGSRLSASQEEGPHGTSSVSTLISDFRPPKQEKVKPVASAPCSSAAQLCIPRQLSVRKPSCGQLTLHELQALATQICGKSHLSPKPL